MKTGITGGIGSGKSYVCQRLSALYGIEVYDCDSAAKRLMRNSARLRRQLTRLIGPEAYSEVRDETGGYTLNKAVVARFLLASDENAHAVDAIVHPAVFRDFETSGMQWMESAILFESGARQLVDKAVVVTAPLEVRIQRIMQRDGITHEKALQWISCQWLQDEVKAHADYEIINDGEADIDSQIEELIKNLEASKHRYIETSK